MQGGGPAYPVRRGNLRNGDGGAAWMGNFHWDRNDDKSWQFLLCMSSESGAMLTSSHELPHWLLTVTQ